MKSKLHKLPIYDGETMETVSHADIYDLQCMQLNQHRRMLGISRKCSCKFAGSKAHKIFGQRYLSEKTNNLLHSNQKTSSEELYYLGFFARKHKWRPCRPCIARKEFPQYLYRPLENRISNLACAWQTSNWDSALLFHDENKKKTKDCGWWFKPYKTACNHVERRNLILNTIRGQTLSQVHPSQLQKQMLSRTRTRSVSTSNTPLRPNSSPSISPNPRFLLLPFIIISLFSLILTPTLALAPGHHPTYDHLCISNAPAIAAPWDCTGYIRCETVSGSGASSHLGASGGFPGLGAFGITGPSGIPGMLPPAPMGVTSRAIWEPCPDGKLYDQQAASCVPDYTECPDPKGKTCD